MNRFIIGTISIIIFSFGILIGILINDVPYLTLDNKVQLGAVIASLFTGMITFSIALLIPYLITKRFDDQKGIKQFLINEIALFCKDLEKIKNQLEENHKLGSIKNDDKREINLLFEYLDTRVDSISQQLKQSFPTQSNNEIEELKSANMLFWKNVTGGELMDEKFKKITPEFWKSSLSAYSDFELKIKMLAHKINKY